MINVVAVTVVETGLATARDGAAGLLGLVVSVVTVDKWWTECSALCDRRTTKQTHVHQYIMLVVRTRTYFRRPECLRPTYDQSLSRRRLRSS